MQIHSKIVLDIATGEIISRETFEYTGPVAQAFSIGGSGGKSKSQNQSQQTSESGTAFNEDFLTKAIRYFGQGQKPGTGTFDAETYLKQNPDVAANPYFSQNPEAHYQQYGQAEGRARPDMAAPETPTYNPQYVKGQFTPGAFTGAAYTPVDGGDFNKIEENLYGGQKARLGQAYDTNVARQREELSQSGALNSPAQFLEGSARSSLDRSYMENLQQAARDASNAALGLKQTEAARKTGFDVGQGAARTAYDVGQGAARTAFSTGEAGRETGFNEQTAAALLDAWFKKIALAIESGRFSRGQGTSYGTQDSMQGGGNLSIFKTAASSGGSGGG